ncbi:MAG TPA: RagB/SusD family nutrient uptake outer membrane protein [Chitinophagaceae bacterium]|nr:RagB/SusD family nutrient uptake outer membrane protein [Chitinophagaceae bacterium]
MNTKYLYHITVAICVVTILGSCKKYLDQQPITDVTTPAVFKDVNGAYLALAGVYSRLAGQEGYGQRLSLYYTVDTDEMQGPTGTDDERRNIARYQPTPSNTGLPAPFNQLFQGIEFANNCIDNIPKMDLYTNGSEQDKKKLQRMYGEALTLRAQFYFEAIRNWGDLPAHFTSASNQAGTDPFPARTDRDTLYNRIIADLKIAEDLVPWRNEVTSIGDPVDERITKGTVKGVRARIALFRGGYSLRQQSKTMERRSDYLTYYQIARDECNDIITSNQHALNPDYKALWKNQVGTRAVTDPQSELMFQVGSIGGVSAEDSRLGFYDGPSVNGQGNRAINILPTYFYLFDSMDVRRDVTIAAYNVGADGKTKVTLGSSGTSAASVLNTGKYRRDWNTGVAPTYTGQFLSLKWQILRYSDVLLMFAEAENEINGPTTAAYSAVNMIRRRGFGKPISAADPTVDLPTGLSKAAFFDYIVRERSLELGGEGVRKYDLIRWNKLAVALTETKTNLGKLATATAMSPVTYMALQPSYVLTNQLPVSMLFRNNSTAEDATLWANSFYRPAPTATPAGTTRVAWINAPTSSAPQNAIGTANLSRFATGFTPGRSELFPIPQPARDANFNLSQNPGY